MSSVQIRGLVKHYDAVPAVRGIDLEVAEGELVVLLGPSGCGKTTTLRCVAGLEDVSAGEIRIGGELMSSAERSVPPEKRQIGMVFQSYAIWPHMSVQQNIAFGLTLKRLPAAEVARRSEAALDLVGLTGYGGRAVSQLSGGQQQRVALARAVVLEPKVLLFDEPLSNLDAKLRERMRFELKQLQRRLGITSLYVTHDQQEAMVIADRVVLMNGGRIEQIGSSLDLYHRPASRFGAEFIGLANVLPGRVVGTGEGAMVELGEGVRVASSHVGAVAEGEVDVLIRPESILPAGEGTEGTLLSTQVEQCYFLGNLSDLYLLVGSVRLRVQRTPAVQYAAGTALDVVIPPDAVLLFPREGAH